MLSTIKRLVISCALVAPLSCVSIPADAAPANFRLQDMQPNGGMYDSNAFLGDPMVIEFYFNGCPYCNTNAPNVKELAAANHPRKAQVIEVSVDEDRVEYDKWFAKHHPMIPVLNGSDEALTRFFGVSSYPSTVVLDKNHNLLFKTVGVWSQATKTRIQRLIDQNQ